jgi:hypothetical protein
MHQKNIHFSNKMDFQLDRNDSSFEAITFFFVF